MNDYSELQERLKRASEPYGSSDYEPSDLRRLIDEAADALAAQAAELERVRAELANCKTVMIAAAEEIAAHWDAHCDAEGYGPQNLLRRLEEGIASEYGYTAGAFSTLKAERDAAVADAERYTKIKAMFSIIEFASKGKTLRVEAADKRELLDVVIDALGAAIDAAAGKESN